MQQLVLELAPPPEPTLTNFAPGPAGGPNARALDAVRALVDRAPEMGVLYLFGPLGSGRTHLLRAATAARPGSIYLSTLDRRLTTLPGPEGLIALDDVESLSASESITMFNAFNSQRAAGGCVLAAGDVSPANLPLRDDLRTRLASGVVIELAPLADVDKLVALRGHARERGMAISDEVLGYLLRTQGRDMGTQTAVLDALDRYSLETKRPLTLPLARTVIAALFKEG